MRPAQSIEVLPLFSGEVRPCPFCAPHKPMNLRVERYRRQIGGERIAIWKMRCMRCGAEGPGDTSQLGAELRWNRRARPAANFAADAARQVPGDLLRASRAAQTTRGGD